jgi:hypothetical protein
VFVVFGFVELAAEPAEPSLSVDEPNWRQDEQDHRRCVPGGRTLPIHHPVADKPGNDDQADDDLEDQLRATAYANLFAELKRPNRGAASDGLEVGLA